MTTPALPLPSPGAEPVKCRHVLDKLAYMHASEDAEERYARGERQTQCPACRLWLWPHEVGDATR